MSDFKVEGPQIKKLLKVARRQPVAFGYNPGNGDEEQYFGLHKQKAAKIIGREAKTEGEGTKYAFGTATLSGKILSLICERELKMMAKRLKKYLKSQKVQLNIEILDPNGNVLESDIEDDLPDDPDMVADEAEEHEAADSARPGDAPPFADETDDADRPSAEQAAPKSDEAALAERLIGLKTEISALQEDASQKLMLALLKVAALLKGGDLASATVGAGKIEGAIAAAGQAVPPPPPPSDQLAKLVQVIKNFRQQSSRIDDETLRDKINQVLAKAAELVKAGDAKGTAEILARVKGALAEAAPWADPMPEPAMDATEGATPEASAEGQAEFGAELAARNRALSADLARVEELQPELAEAAATAWAEIAALQDAGSVDEALDRVDALEVMLVAALPPSNVRFQQLRLRWQDAKKQATTLLDALGKAFTAEFPETESQTAAARLDGVLATFNAGLADALDDLVNTEHGPARNTRKEAARAIVTDYLGFLATSPLVAHIDDNPFMPVAVQAELTQPLALLDAELAKGAA